MALGVFYSVGVGPGDPELLTFKAAQTIACCDIIATPDSGAAENMALRIAAQHIQGKRLVTCPMPMTRDAATMAACHRQAADVLGALLDEGLNIAFLTLGDPSIYSTAMYVHRLLAEQGYETRIIPGIPSFCAAAASLNTTLCEGAEPLHIIPASYNGEYAALDGTKVVMKSGASLNRVLAELRQQSSQIMLVERASLPEERVYGSLAEIPEQAGYFSLAVVKPMPEEKPADSSVLAASDTLAEGNNLGTFKYFPLFIHSSGKKALIAGAGPVATRRVAALLNFGFAIMVVAPQATTEIAGLAAAGRIHWQQREFQGADLAGCFLVVAATNKREVNHHIAELAAQSGLWVSVADKHEEGNLLFPALAMAGDIVAGITSNGTSPTKTKLAARKIREALK